MKRDRDYELVLNKKKKRKHKEPEESPESKNIMNVEDVLGEFNETVTYNNNHIYFYGSVNTKNCLKLNLYIRDINRKLTITENDFKVSNLKIYIHINSFGGSVFGALACVDTILSSKYPVVSIIEGGSASAATMISVVCSERVITKNAYMLIHQLSSGFWGKMEEIKDEFKNLKKLMKKIKEIYKVHTKLTNGSDSKIRLNDLLKRDLWLDSDECLKYGLVDKIDFY